MNCKECGAEYWTTSQKRKHDAEKHNTITTTTEKPVKRTTETTEVECQICGNNFLVRLDSLKARKQFTCSGTCRGHFYRNIEDAELIEKAIEYKTTDKLKYTIKRVLALGFKVEIT